MARFYAVVLVAIFAVSGIFATINTNPADAADKYQVSRPIKDGNDILFPDAFIKTVPLGAGDQVWVAFHDEGRFELMTQEGSNWRAKDAVGKDVHPYVGDPIGNYKPLTNYCKIERMPWGNDRSVVGFRGPYINIHIE